jgi:prepilin-type N-terminal cleavage/methylation domain-containing protein
MPVRHGLTLPETVMVLAILGLTMGIATLRIAAFQDSLSVEREAQRIASAHRRGRVMAISRGQPAVLSIGSDTIGIALAGDAGDLWGSKGPSASGVALAGPIRRMTFSPAGYGTGLSNASFRLSRGSAQRTVVVSRLGRVRITRP